MKFFRQLVSLCGSFKAYRAVPDLPLVSSIKYLVKLMVLLALVLMVTFVPVLLATFHQFAQWMEEKLPPFRIEDNQIHTDVTQPYIAGDDDFRVILDTTGQVAAIDSNAVQGIWIKSNSYVFWVSNPETKSILSREWTFNGFPNGDVNRDYLRRWVRLSLPVALPMLFLIALLLGLLITLIQAYLFAMVGSLMEGSGAGTLQMSQLLNIAIHAVTPGAIIVTAYMAMQLKGLNLGLIYLAAYGIVLLGATNACRRTEEDVEA